MRRRTRIAILISIAAVGLVGLFALVGAVAAESEVAATPDATSAVSPVPRGRIDLAPDLYLRQIGQGAYVIVHAFPWPANSLLVEMDDGTLVLAGSPYTPAAVQSVLAWATRRSWTPASRSMVLTLPSACSASAARSCGRRP